MSFLKKSFSVLPAMAIACIFAACGSDSTSARPEEEFYSSSSEATESSSSVSSSSFAVISSSSSSVKDNSSSSVAPSSSSADIASSSSVDIASSSSAVTANSSSNVVPSSSSAVTPSNVEGSSSSVASSSSSSIISVVKPADVITGTMVDARDNQTYKTVTVGSQTWMAENLNYDYNVPTRELNSSSFCYKKNESYCEQYGRLYLWSAAMDSAAKFSNATMGCGDEMICGAREKVRGVCPEGWHLPSDDEWNHLLIAVGGTSKAGALLKSSDGWGDGFNGTDAYGFSVLPAGYRSQGDQSGSGSFSNATTRGYTYFWSSTESSSAQSHVKTWGFNYGSEEVSPRGNFKGAAYSIRCVKD